MEIVDPTEYMKKVPLKKHSSRPASTRGATFWQKVLSLLKQRGVELSEEDEKAFEKVSAESLKPFVEHEVSSMSR